LFAKRSAGFVRRFFFSVHVAQNRSMIHAANSPRKGKDWLPVTVSSKGFDPASAIAVIESTMVAPNTRSQAS
jgi:hypothetical protein